MLNFAVVVEEPFYAMVCILTTSPEIFDIRFLRLLHLVLYLYIYVLAVITRL